jgi:hypothetical protein
VDLVPGQVLEPRLCGVTEVGRHVLDDKKVIFRSPSVAGESAVLEPHAGVGVPVVPRYIGRSMETGGEPRIAVVVAVAVMASPASSILVVARAVVDALGPL